MNEPLFRLTVLGTRGSMAICKKSHSLFGGDTSCYYVQAGEESLFLDGGSGLLCAPTEFSRPPVILLTHLHLDHLLGLGMYPRLSRRGEQTQIFVPAPDEEGALSALDRLYRPPYWPLSLTAYAGDVRVKPLLPSFSVGVVQVQTLEGNHPGGCTVIRLQYAGKTLVYATDYERDEPSFTSLIGFAKGADLLLYDGQYVKEELPAKRGFGHSTAEDGIELMERCGAKRLLIVHHDPGSTDEMLLEREARIHRPDVHYARAGGVFDL
ncbi:MAG: hypothetical protein IJ573_10640 [Clostridia bacterium]|nr:hypothetical protein [Clostridia bacterium]